jgi:hypothetical protein
MSTTVTQAVYLQEKRTMIDQETTMDELLQHGLDHSTHPQPPGRCCIVHTWKPLDIAWLPQLKSAGAGGLQQWCVFCFALSTDNANE